MHRLLTTLGRGFKEKIGWKRLGIAASLLIIILAVTHLVRTLKGVDTAIILTALTEIEPHRIGLAALCVVGALEVSRRQATTVTDTSLVSYLLGEEDLGLPVGTNGAGVTSGAAAGDSGEVTP